MKTALITGASSGIGFELAKIHASKGGNLVLVARSTQKLMELKTSLESEYKTEVIIITKDLSKDTAAQEIYDEVQKLGIEVDYLINNAGVGAFGDFHETDWQKQDFMIRLNILALTHLTHLFLQDMTAKKSGKILNVASTAAFQPGPGMAVYFATKSFVLHFSEAINSELLGTGVTVTALCPGPTTTNFEETANLGESNLFKILKPATAKYVAEFGYKAMLRGTPVVVPKFLNNLLIFSNRFAPRSVVVKATKRIQGKTKK